MARALLRIPATAARGQVVEIRTLIQHPMETGYRPGADGTVQPRDIIRRFTCHYNNRPVFEAALHPAIAANPFLSFTIVAVESGILAFSWEGDNGFAQTETRAFEVT